MLALESVWLWQRRQASNTCWAGSAVNAMMVDLPP